MENRNMYELLNSAIQSSKSNKVNFSSLYALLKAMLQQLDSLRGTGGIHTGEDGVSEVAPGQKSVISVERCCHRVDALEGTLRSLRDTLQKSPELAELCQSVSWDFIQPEGLQEEGGQSLCAPADFSRKTEKELLNAGLEDPSHTPAAPGSSLKSEKSVQEDSDVQPAADAFPASSGPRTQSPPVTDQMPTTLPGSPDASDSESCTETEMSPRTFSKLMERDLYMQNMTDQLKQQGALIDRLMEKHDALEEMVMNSTDSGAASESLDGEGKAYHELKQQISHVRKSVKKLEDDMKQTKPRQALREESTADRQLQNQVTAAPPTPQNASSSESSTETAMSPRTAGKLMERFSKLEALVAEGKVDQTQLREIINKRVDASKNMTDQLKQQGALIDRLMSDCEKLDALEEMVMNPPGSEAASGSVDADGKAYHELKQQISHVRKSVKKLEDDMKQMKSRQALREESTADRQLQNQVPAAPPTPQNASSSESSTETAMSPRTAGKLEALVAEGKVDQTQLREITNKRVDASKNMTDQLKQQGALINRDRKKDLELVNDLQKAILQLQAECEKLNETTRCLQEDSVQKQSYIKELYKTTEEFSEESKAGKEMTESVMKSYKLSLDGKVSKVQFDSVIEQLNALFDELLNKVSGQEQVFERISSEMECKLNRAELDPVRKQLEERWGWIQKKLQDQKTPEVDGAAMMRKQLMDSFHCLSCDRPLKNPMALNSTELPSSYTSHRQFTVSPQEKFRQDKRSKYFSEDYSYPPVSRSCGGKGTLTTRTMLFSEQKKMRDLQARARKSLPQ